MRFLKHLLLLFVIAQLSCILDEIPDAPGGNPTASFTIGNNGCEAPCTVSFTSTSTGDITTYSWDFGDPGSGSSNTSGLENPGHEYAVAGTYTVSLTVSGPGGTDEVTNEVTINSEGEGGTPVASFSTSVDSCSVSCTIQFTNTSQNADTFSWDFGDGNTSSEENPSHTYMEPGTYEVALTASTADQSDLASREVYLAIPTFLNFLSDPSEGTGTAVVQNEAGDFFVIGIDRDSDDDGDFLVLRTDGNTTLQKHLLGSANRADSGNDILLSTQNDLGITGRDGQFYHAEKLNFDFSSEWEQRSVFIGGGTNATAIAEADDRGFVVMATGIPDAGVGYWSYFTKYASNGDFEWSEGFGFSLPNDNLVLNALIKTEQGGFVAAGYSSHSGGQNQLYLASVKANGDKDIEKEFASGTGHQLIQTSDGGFLVAGTIEDGGTPNALVLKTSQNGTDQDELSFTYRGVAEALAVAPLSVSNGRFLVAGYTAANASARRSIFVQEIVVSGSSLSAGWARFYEDGQKSLSANDIEPTIDGGFILIGNGIESGVGGDKPQVLLLKIDEIGFLEK